MAIPEKVRCSINHKWFVDGFGNPSDKGTPVFAWCEAHDKPMALLSKEDELAHDRKFHK
jgi:hypothetical protein